MKIMEKRDRRHDLCVARSFPQTANSFVVGQQHQVRNSYNNDHDNINDYEMFLRGCTRCVPIYVI